LKPPSRFPRLLSRRSLIAAGVAAIGAAAGVAVPLSTRGSFYPGTVVNGVDISEQTFDGARALLQQHFAPFEDHAVDFVFDDQRWPASLDDLGFAINYDATLDAAYTHGRDGGVVERYSGVLLTTIDEAYPLVFTENRPRLVAFLEQIGPEIKGAARDARLYLSDGEIRILDNRDGRQLNVEQAVDDAVTVVRTGATGEVALTTVPVVSQVTTADLEPVKARTELMISSPVHVISGGTRWTIPREMLLEALTLPPAEESGVPPWLDASLLQTGLQGIADEMYLDPVNAVVGWDGGLVAIEPDQPGHKVDLEALAERIVDAAATEDARTVDLPLVEIPAQVRADALDELGIAGLMAEGSSSFVGSSEARAENVRVSARHLTHTLIPPGGKLVFNDALGRISTDRDFVEGKIIRGDWIVSDLGGGACQASTTVFRAALFAGLDFEEWHPHSFRLSFYEADGSPPGLDAAIYQPNNENEWELDLIFTNPTESWMLMEMTTEGETAVTSLFGPDLGYDVEVTVPYISDPIKPKGPMEKEEPKLAKGQREIIQSEQDGYEVLMRRVVKKDGDVVSDQEFFSKYEPQRETWAIGPGTPRKYDDKGEELTPTPPN
jgi:vancomycin resistance protein YoaR